MAKTTAGSPLRATLLLAFALLRATAAAAEPQLYVQLGHAKDVDSLLFYGPDRLVTASSDGTARLWDVKNGRELRTFQVDDIKVQFMMLAPDGHTLLLAAMARDEVLLFDLRKEGPPVVLRGHQERATGAAFIPQRGQVATTSLDRTVRLWSQATGELLRTFQVGDAENAPWCVAVSPDQRRLAVGMTRKLVVIDAGDGHVISSRASDDQRTVDSVEFLPDGRLVDFYRSGGKPVAIDPVTQLPKGTLPPREDDPASSDGKLRWKHAADDEIAILDQRGKERRSFRVPGGKNAAWRSGTHQLAIAVDNQVQLWDADRPRLLSTLRGHASVINEATLGADGTLYLNTNRALEILRPGARGAPAHLDIEGFGFAVSADGKRLAARTKAAVQVWDTASLQTIRTLPSAGSPKLAFSPDGGLLARGHESRSSGDMVQVVDLASGAVQRGFPIQDHSKSIYEVAFSPDGELLGTVQPKDFPNAPFGSHDSDLTLWRLEDGEALGHYPGQQLRFSPDGKRFLYEAVKEGTGKPAGVEIRQTSGELVSHLDCPALLDASPDFRLLAVLEWKGWAGPRDVQLLDLASGRQLGVLSVQQPGYPHAQFSADGKRLLISGEASVEVWDTEGRRPLARIYPLDEADWLAVAPDGRFEGTPAAFQLLFWKSGEQMIPLDSFFERFYTPGLLAQVLTGQLQTARPAQELGAAVSPTPLVRILSPKPGASGPQEEVEVELEATDQGGGVQELRLYLNGKLVEGEGRGLRKREEAKKLTRTLRVALLAGKNRLRATALNDARTESEGAELEIVRDAASAQSDLHLIVIGIDKYDNPKYQLGYATTDARAFHDAVIAHGKGIFRKVIAQLLLDGDARKPGIERALARVQAEARPEDALVLYYAGHGVMSEGTPKLPSRFFLVPPEVIHLYGDDDGLEKAGVSVEQLQRWSTQVKAQKQLLVLDACQSGGAVEQFAMRGAAEEKAILQLARSAGVVVLAATGTEQLAGEFTQLGHGVFTYALLQGLAGEADAGRPPDGKITVKELEAYLNDKVPELTRKYRGTAQYPNSFARGQDFPLGVTTR